MFHNWWRRVWPNRPARPSGLSFPNAVLHIEDLESRCLLSTTFLETNLVGDAPGLAKVTDPNLINPWGMALNTGTGFFWLGDNGSGKSTLYDANGQPAPAGSPLVVTIPTSSASPPGTKATPTGTVFNSGSGFVVSKNGASGSAQFLFDTEDGTISGWSPNVDSTHAILAVDHGADTVYKGLALGTNAAGVFLFAANFRSGKIDVFDQKFAPATLSGNFTDSAIPAGFAPFNIKNLGGKLFVTYAKQDAAKHNDVAGVGNGFVDVYDTNGTLLQRLASGGLLNSPWGETIAPAQFGDFSNDVLVGNFRDGRINAFDPTTGASLGQLKDNTGKALTIDGLWALAPGAGTAATNTLYFTAGPNGQQHGLFGKLQVNLGFAVAGNGHVQVYQGTGGTLVSDFMPFGTAYTGGISVALGDVNNDGVKDLVVGTTSGSPQVKVFDGKAVFGGTFDPNNPGASQLASFNAFDPKFNTGVNVAVGDVSGNGFADIVTGASAGNPDVRVFSGKDIANHTFNPTGASQLVQFFAYGLQFNVGANVAVGDLNGDGFADLVTGATAGNPHVKVYTGKAIANHTFNPSNPDASLLTQFFAYGLQFNVGAFVAVGDVNGDGHLDLITGATAGNPHVKVYNGAAIANGSFNGNNPDANLMSTFFAYDLQFNVGAAVAAADFEGTGKFDILTGASVGSPHYRIVKGNATGTKPPTVNGIEGIPKDIQGGIRVGA
jgi:uncharacterized protein (TIGR03118 family)